MMYKIYPYSSYDNWTVKSCGSNVSDIMSKMVERAGRLCESYASDIYYTLNSYYEAVQNNKAYNSLLAFREHGVIEKCVEDGNVEFTDTSNDLQYWLLSWDSAEKEGVFTRVGIRRCVD